MFEEKVNELVKLLIDSIHLLRTSQLEGNLKKCFVELKGIYMLGQSGIQQEK